MRGQWLGRYEGSYDGQLMLNIDEVDDHFEGIAYLVPLPQNIPITVAYIKTENKASDSSVVADTFPIDPRTLYQVNWEQIKALYPEGTSHASKAKVSLRILNEKLVIEANSDNGVQLNATLDRQPKTTESKIVGQKMSWSDFKSHAATLSNSNFLFRGQQKDWKLCTSFHRRGRYRMNTFISGDVRLLHRRLSAITSHFFDLANPDQNGAFFNLLQHHGYPTPLLDWSYSPYVAAFFAFRDVQIGYKGDDVVRVYKFDSQEWHRRHIKIENLDPPFPHLSVMEFIARDNPRVIPQQAATTVTNLYDIEAYVLEKEAQLGVKFLQAIDISADERDLAMKELRFMGITAGSMFPGIDGVCEEIRERNFDQ